MLQYDDGIIALPAFKVHLPVGTRKVVVNDVARVVGDP